MRNMHDAKDGHRAAVGEAVVLVDPEPSLMKSLLPIARRIFTDAFAHYYNSQAFEMFCDEVYKPGGSMSRDFDHPEVEWRVAVAGDTPIGYVKLTPLRAPAVEAAKSALEMQQLYVLSSWHGLGVADKLAAWALYTARARKASELYLTVFDHNERAKRFYSRYGFMEVGRCTFQLGDRIDDDRIWRLKL